MVLNSKLVFEIVFFEFWKIFDQFWKNFQSKLASPKLRKSVPDAFPTTNWTPKAVWTSLGHVLGLFLKHFFTNFAGFCLKSSCNSRSKLCKYESVSALRLWPSFLPPCLYPTLSFDGFWIPKFVLSGLKSWPLFNCNVDSFGFSFNIKTRSAFLRSSFHCSLELLGLEDSMPTWSGTNSANVCLHVFNGISLLNTSCTY